MQTPLRLSSVLKPYTQAFLNERTRANGTRTPMIQARQQGRLAFEPNGHKTLDIVTLKWHKYEHWDDSDRIDPIIKGNAMRWFGRKSADAPQTFLSYALSSERALFPAGYQAQVKEVFLGNPVGQRAVRMVAGASIDQMNCRR